MHLYKTEDGAYGARTTCVTCGTPIHFSAGRDIKAANKFLIVVKAFPAQTNVCSHCQTKPSTQAMLGFIRNGHRPL